MTQAEALRRAILDELSIDVYASQDTKRYLLTDLTLQAIAIACAAAFIKGFFNFGALGGAVREKLLGLLADFHAKRALDSYQDSGELTALLTAARRDSTQQVTATEQQKGEQELTAALIAFGMAPDDAAAHAKQIAAIVTRTLNDRG